MLRLREDGQVILQKDLPRIELAAMHDTTLSLAQFLPLLKPGHEYLADIHFSLPADEPWAAKGFEVAADQFVLTKVPLINNSVRRTSPAELHENTLDYQISGNDFQIEVSKNNGALTSYLWKGQEQIYAPLLPHFTRPLTDNDRRGWKANKKMKPWYADSVRLKEVSAKTLPDGIVAVTSIYILIGDSVTASVKYLVNNRGLIKVHYQLISNPALPNIPEVGMQCGIIKSDSTITWYGRGLYENYTDRCTGFEAGIYTQPISRFNEPYVVPQETGNRTDVRWMFLGNKNAKGLMVVADSLLSINAWPYTQKNIENAKHTDKLKDAGYITLNIDLLQMGVGGNDSWSDVGAPLPQYQIPSKNYHYSFYLLPGEFTADKAVKLARTVKFNSAD